MRRTTTGWCAGIPELGVSAESSEPNSAITSVTDEARKICEVLVSTGSAVPPPGPLGPLTLPGSPVDRSLGFLRRLIASYVLVLALTLILILMITPFLLARSQSYLSSGKATEDVGRILTKLNISACVGQR